eukprot:Opistho-1_new@34248
MNGLSVSQRPLFGGAMSLCLPASFVDVSAIREVPDNQEVLVHMESDQSVIVELVEHEAMPDEQAPIHHFEALASDNDAKGHSVTGVARLTPADLPLLGVFAGSSAFLLEGQQSVSKYHESPSTTSASCSASFASLSLGPTASSRSTTPRPYTLRAARSRAMRRRRRACRPSSSKSACERSKSATRHSSAECVRVRACVARGSLCVMSCYASFCVA